jgi:hypothetical protein
MHVAEVAEGALDEQRLSVIIIDGNSFHKLAVFLVEVPITLQTAHELPSGQFQSREVLIGDDCQDGQGGKVKLSSSDERPLVLVLPVSQ